MNIAVAGCGIAGMASALLLARQGHRVTIFERFAEARPVGSGLLIQPTGQAVLARLGLLDALLDAGARVTGLFGRSEGRVALDVSYDWLNQQGACGIGIHRAALFDILHDAVAAAGVPIEGECAVAGSETVGAGRRLVFADGDPSPPFDLVVDALGASSPLAGAPARPLAYGALWATLDWVDGFAPDMLEQRYRRARKMVGVLPAGRGKAAFFWSLRGDALGDWRTRGLRPWKEEVLALWPETAGFLDQIDDSDQLTFARYAHRTLFARRWPATRIQAAMVAGTFGWPLGRLGLG